MEEIRLQKFLANSGICSRRNAEKLIIEGKVIVNGNIVTELGTKVNPEKDEVLCNGSKVRLEKKHVYVLLNKPIGYVTTVKEQFNRPTVMDLVKEVDVNLLPVGRLDMYTSGALILTNDGDFIYTITHPKNEVEKTYNATVRGIVSKDDVRALEHGVQVEDYTTGKAKVKILKTDEQKNLSRLQITIHEGKNREVRKMCEAVGKPVISLHRARIGNIDVKDLKIGTWRYLSEKEIKSFLN